MNQQPPSHTLMEFLMRVYQKLGGAPLQKQAFETQNGEHGMKLTVGGFTGEAISPNRKTSQNLAAKQVLLKIIDADRFAEVGIPGTSKDEARQFIHDLQASLDQDEQLTHENWPGKCDDLCLQKKLSVRPEYEYVEVEKMFRCICKLRDIIVEELGTSKRKAKAAAAKSMFEKILELEEHRVEQTPRTIQQPVEKRNNAVDIVMEEVTEAATHEPKETLHSFLTEEQNHPETMSNVHLLRRIFTFKDDPSLKKIWPECSPMFYLDSKELNPLDDLDIEESRRNNDEYRVFAELRNTTTGHPINLFMGLASSIREATEIAAGRAVKFIKAKLKIYE